MINIDLLFSSDIEEVFYIAKKNYYKERIKNPVLPEKINIDFLAGFGNNNCSVKAYDEGGIIGYLCGTPPFLRAFGSTEVSGVFSPMGSNGITNEKNINLYTLLYQKAADLWVKAGAVSHAVSLYSHDVASNELFFKYGFGMRCVDAVRPMKNIDFITNENYKYSELDILDYVLVYPLYLMLFDHHKKSLFFMSRKPETKENFINSCFNNKSRFFAARYKDNIVAFLKISKDGETFVCSSDDYIHIGGAYCTPDHRGLGIMQSLINYAIPILKSEGYNLLGVDFESINPIACNFWSKYFFSYNQSVVRRIDENILIEYNKNF